MSTERSGSRDGGEPGGYIGRGVRRVEDERLVRGEGSYVGNLRMEGCLEAAFARSPVAHGGLLGVGLDAARQVPGVVGAWSARDLSGLQAQPIFPLPVLEGRDWPALATDRVRFVGETVAVVVAEDRHTAEDGVELVDVEVEEFPSVLDPTEAAFGGAPELFEGLPNVVGEWTAGEPVGEEVFEGAPVVVEASYRQPLLAPNSIEGRAILAKPDDDGGIRVWCSHQAPHRLRNNIAAALEIQQEKVRVIVGDVGGGFGGKSATFPEYVVVAALARRLGRPVRWVEDRSEALFGATHGRGQNQRVRLAADDEGRMLALEVEVDGNMGAYAHYGPLVLWNTMGNIASVYGTPRVYGRARGVVTNTTPTGPYRGAGRPEAAYAVERTVDLLARRLGLDPAELRMRNFIQPEELPYESPAGAVYDSGDYPAALGKALEAIGYDGWRVEQRRRRETGEGPPLGIGLCSYLENSGIGGEFGAVEALADGTFVAVSGSCPMGTSHETTFAQVVASVLGVEPGRVRVVEGDTAFVPRGMGSFASRSMQVGGAALYRAATGLVEEARRRAAEHYGVLDTEVEYREGVLSAGGEEIGLAGLVGRTGPLRADEWFEPPTAYPHGCCGVVVEVDPELGNVRVVRLAFVDDCGVVINPLVVEGQMYGSIVQGLGQALYEEVPYDARGRPLLDNGLLDYLMPTFSELPLVRLEEMESPNPNTPLGAKGVGESGCIGVPPAVVNAVSDALDLDDPSDLQVPLTPETVWRAMGNPAAIATATGTAVRSAAGPAGGRP